MGNMPIFSKNEAKNAKYDMDKIDVKNEHKKVKFEKPIENIDVSMSMSSNNGRGSQKQDDRKSRL